MRTATAGTTVRRNGVGGLRRAAAFCALAGLLALAVAMGSERFGGLVPCALCLVERWPYRVAVALGVIGVALPRSFGRAATGLAVVALLAGAGVAAVHVGVEQGWWPSPLPECAAPRFSGGSIAERLAAMPAHPAKPCDAPSFLLPGVPVSMAQMNLLYALLSAAGAVVLLRRARPSA